MAWKDTVDKGREAREHAMGLKFLFGRDITQDPFGDVAAAREQRQAQVKALGDKERLYREDEALRQRQQAGAISARERAYSGGRQALSQASVGAARAIDDGYGQTMDDVGWLRELSNASGYNKSMREMDRVGRLSSYADQAAAGYQPTDVYGQRSDMLGGMLDQGLYSGFDQDQGYNAAMQAGMDAVSGPGRTGAEMEALGGYGQGMAAAQEYENFIGRRQAEAGAAGGYDAMDFNALAAQANRQDQASAMANQQAMGLAQTGFGAQSKMGQMAMGEGKSRMGAAYDFGKLDSALLGDMAQKRAGVQSASAGSLAQLGATLGRDIGDIYMGGAVAGTKNLGDMFSAYQTAAQSGGMVEQARANNTREIIGAVTSSIGENMRKKEEQEARGR